VKRLCALIALIASGCAPIEPPAPVPAMYPVTVGDHACTALENARGEALLICDFEPIPATAEVAKEML